MGSVYKARDTETGRTAALKILAPELASNPVLVERFKREARHAQKLRNKHIVELYGFGEEEGLHYLAMEYVDGVDLADYIRRKGRIDHEEARRIIIHACKALMHASEHGIIHRDIKPSNFLLANDEGRCRVKLTDLGLSRMVDDEDFRVTRAGTTVGTVDYMAPEQARDASLADIRSDIYALGCTLYHMLAGRPPFAEGGLGERVYKHIAADPPDIRELNPDVPPALWTILRRMLAKHPDDRFQTPAEVIEALRSLIDPGPSSSSGTGPRPLPPGAELMDVTPPSVPACGQASPPSPYRKPLTPPPAAPDSDPSTPFPPRKRQTTLPEMATTPDDPDLLGVTPEQRNAASGQFSHATEVARKGGNAAYALDLLLSCVKLDPANTLYRKMLREVGREQGSGKGGWFTSLTTLPARARIKSAARAGEHRKVLEQGEELLLRVPGDISVQLDMAASAESLGLPGLATWMLEEARQHAPLDASILRALGELYERRKMYKEAIDAWEQVRKADPGDTQASTRIKDLAATEAISKARRSHH
jgi:serine/threonine protein kinase